jgi:predicted ATPase
MNVSIYNFKTIRDLNHFEIKPLTIISGVNSSGKTSIIQFLVLLKQTAELKATNKPLVLDGEYINLGNYSEIVYNHNLNTNIAFSFSFSKGEFRFPDLEYLNIKNFILYISFSYTGDHIIVETLELKYFTPDIVVKEEQWINFTKSGEKYQVKTNTGVFNNEFYQLLASTEKGVLDGDLLLSFFIPQMFVAETDNSNYPELDTNPTKKISIEPKFRNLQHLLEEFFNGISYIGPLREQPKDFYIGNEKNKAIGTRGEYAAYILEKEADKEVEYYQLVIRTNGTVEFVKTISSLANAVNYWICEVFDLAKSIRAEEYKDEYIIKVVNHFEVETTIKHVGFGISQILPIVVEGLRVPNGSIIVLEQPEIHLHPKIQSYLFDFLHSLTMCHKKFIIETHSDHFITRMRRRIAEDVTDELTDKINAVFIEKGEVETIIRKLDFTEMGSLTYYPVDFVEQTEVEFRSIVKAQATKRIIKKQK